MGKSREVCLGRWNLHRHLQMSLPPSWIVINFQRCCHPGILLRSSALISSSIILASFSDIVGTEKWICFKNPRKLIWTYSSPHDLIMLTRRRACPGASAVVSPLTCKSHYFSHLVTRDQRYYGLIEKAVLNPHRHIESSYAWPRPGPSCAFETISLFLVSGFNPYLCLARSDLLLLDFHLGHFHGHHNHHNLCHLHYHLSTLDYKISKYWRVLAKFSNCHQSRSQNLSQNSLKCLAYSSVLEKSPFPTPRSAVWFISIVLTNSHYCHLISSPVK